MDPEDLLLQGGPDAGAHRVRGGEMELESLLELPSQQRHFDDNLAVLRFLADHNVSYRCINSLCIDMRGCCCGYLFFCYYTHAKPCYRYSRRTASEDTGSMGSADDVAESEESTETDQDIGEDNLDADEDFDDIEDQQIRDMIDADQVRRDALQVIRDDAARRELYGSDVYDAALAVMNSGKNLAR